MGRPDLPLALLAALCLAAPALAQEREVDLQLVLAVDVSRSMDMEEAALQRLGFVGAFRHPEVVDAIRRGRHGRIAVTYVEWGGDFHQKTRVGWTEVSDTGSAEAFAGTIESATLERVQRTSISGALMYGARLFAGNGFASDRRVIDVSGDGPNNAGPYVDNIRDVVVGEGITINGLPIINDRPNNFGFPNLPDLDLYYENCVIGGPAAFIEVAHGFSDFARAILRKLVTEIAGLTPTGPLLRHAAWRPPPPCDIGEIQLRDWLQYQE